MRKVAVAWSGGKDSAVALERVKKSSRYKVGKLFTNLGANGRVSIHGLRKKIVERQAEELGLEIEFNQIPAECTGEEYGELMESFYEKLQKEGVEAVVFADIFDTDSREHREELLKKSELEGIWPIWSEDATRLAEEIRSRMSVKVIAVTKPLTEDFVGRKFDSDFLEQLPEEVDSCGENGEFHTVVENFSLFTDPVKLENTDKSEEAIKIG